MIRFFRLVLAHPIWTLLILAGITLVFGLFLPRIGFQADYSKMLPEDDPIVAQYKKTRTSSAGSLCSSWPWSRKRAATSSILRP
jgi:predicted RND superfamily exporter protein